jgi:PPOX class probable F420-dependent enzyme
MDSAPGNGALDLRLAQWLQQRHEAVLATTRRDDSPQTSNIMYAFDGERARISVTTSRAKTANMRRHPAAVLHVLGDTFWQYAAVTCRVTLGPVATEPGDEAGRELLALYQDVAHSPHPDVDEFYNAMVAENRLVARLTPVSAVTAGLVWETFTS